MKALSEYQTSVSSRLSPERQAEISELAAAVVEAHCPDGRIDPEKIIKAKQISLLYDSYGDSFDGMIEYAGGRFYIHCNLDRDNTPRSTRGRFTLAHELGHYFIDEHRNNLANARVLPHPSFSDKCRGDSVIEREADFFASRLLMPDVRFRPAVRRTQPGLRGIELIANEFEVSLTCAAIRFVTSEVFPSVLIKWSSEGYAWKWSSERFWTMGYRKTRQSIESLPQESATRQCLGTKRLQTGVLETASTASWWFSGISDGSYKNVVLREEAIALGKFGVLTLLTLRDGKFPEELLRLRDAELGY